MIKIIFEGNPTKITQLVYDFIDFAGDLGVYGGGGWNTTTGQGELYMRAHSNCDCNGYPKLNRISPKIRYKMLDWLHDKGYIPTWEHTR